MDCTDYDSNAIRSVVFHPDGACVFGGSTDLLKVYGWEPSRCLDSVNMGWGKVADMAMAQTQLVRFQTLLHLMARVHYGTQSYNQS